MVIYQSFIWDLYVQNILEASGKSSMCSFIYLNLFGFTFFYGETKHTNYDFKREYFSIHHYFSGQEKNCLSKWTMILKHNPSIKVLYREDLEEYRQQTIQKIRIVEISLVLFKNYVILNGGRYLLFFKYCRWIFRFFKWVFVKSKQSACSTIEICMDLFL